MLLAHHEETRALPGQRDNARNNARCTQARKTMPWLRGTVVERRSVTGELSVFYSRPAADE